MTIHGAIAAATIETTVAATGCSDDCASYASAAQSSFFFFYSTSHRNSQSLLLHGAYQLPNFKTMAKYAAEFGLLIINPFFRRFL